MKLHKLALSCYLLLVSLTHSASFGADLYDNIGQSVTINGNFSDGSWPALSFRTTLTDTILDTVTIPLRNPNLLSSGSISFWLYDATGTASAPGSAVGAVLGSTPVAGISQAVYQDVTFSGLNRNLSSNTNYWIVVISTGLSSGYQVGATSSTGGTISGSLGYSISNDGGTSWTAPSADLHVIGRVTAVPEPSAYFLAAIGAAAACWAARRSRPAQV